MACVNSKGQLVGAWTYKTEADTSTEGEAKAAIATIQCARLANVEHLLLKEDAQDVVEDFLYWDLPQTAVDRSIIQEANKLLQYSLCAERRELLSPYII